MPGVFGALSRNKALNPQPVAMRMLELLKHREFYKSAMLQEGHSVVAGLSTNPWFDRASRSAQLDNVLILVEGTAFVVDGIPVADDRPDLAQIILDLYLSFDDDFT